jgi:hypothetical protein
MFPFLTYLAVFSVPYTVRVHKDWMDNEETGKSVRGPCGFRGVYGLTAAITDSYAAESMDVRLLCLM